MSAPPPKPAIAGPAPPSDAERARPVSLPFSGAAMVAGVVGAPVGHSLSPLIHNAWIAAAGLDAVYVPFAPAADGFARFVHGLRGGVVRGLNVTVPFKVQALALADRADAAAEAAGAANLLLFDEDGGLEARNTDGAGLLTALRSEPGWGGWRPEQGAAVILGAGGAARGAAAALAQSGAPELRIVNRTLATAEALAREVGARSFAWEALPQALHGASLVVNATTRGLGGRDPLALDWPAPPPPRHASGVFLHEAGGVAMDMVYSPLRTEFLQGAARAGWWTVDGLAMLIGQARPSFEAFFGRPPPEETHVRPSCIRELERRG